MFADKWNELNKNINNTMGSSLFYFKFEREKYSKMLIISKAKNT
jgi:hypothetical protein